MTQKRGGEDYEQRRTSQQEMMNQGGLVSGWFNSTFKGYQKPAAGADQQKAQQQQQQQQQQKRGVME